MKEIDDKEDKAKEKSNMCMRLKCALRQRSKSVVMGTPWITYSRKTSKKC